MGNKSNREKERIFSKRIIFFIPKPEWVHARLNEMITMKHFVKEAQKTVIWAEKNSLNRYFRRYGK